jgi:O-antigen polymerase
MMIDKKHIFYLLILLPLLVIPFVYSNDLYNGIISAKQLWFYGTIALLIVGAVISLVFTRPTASFVLNQIDMLVLIFYGYLVLRTVTTPQIPILHNSRFINYSLCVVLYFVIKYFIARTSKSETDQSHLSSPISIDFPNSLVFILILSGLGQAVWGLLQLYDIVPGFSSYFKITGSFYNPAPYALYLAVIFQLALGNILFRSIHKKGVFSLLNYYFSIVTLTAILVVLPATMIRAAWIGAVAGSIVMLNYKYRFIEAIKQILNTRTQKFLVFVAAIAIITVTISGLFYLKKDSANGKLFIWEVTLNKAVDKPLFGYGVGRFEAEYNNWQADYFKSNPEQIDKIKGMAAGNTRYAFNEYLEILAEQGIIGLVLFVILIIATIRSLQKENRLSETVMPAFISLLVCACISFPFYSLPSFILFFILLGVHSSQIKKEPVADINTKAFFTPKILTGAVVVVLIPVAAYSFLMAASQYKAYRIWYNASFSYQMEDYAGADNSLSTIYTPLQYTGAFLQYYGKALNQDKKFNPSIQLLNKAKMLTTDDVLFTTMGDSYNGLKAHIEAEKAYKQAMFMAPNKLYPRYKLANYYYLTGQKTKALVVAKNIINRKMKVESRATDEMVQAMKELINQINDQKKNTIK